MNGSTQHFSFSYFFAHVSSQRPNRVLPTHLSPQHWKDHDHMSALVPNVPLGALDLSYHFLSFFLFPHQKFDLVAFIQLDWLPDLMQFNGSVVPEFSPSLWKVSCEFGKVECVLVILKNSSLGHFLSLCLQQCNETQIFTVKFYLMSQTIAICVSFS